MGLNGSYAQSAKEKAPPGPRSRSPRSPASPGAWRRPLRPASTGRAAARAYDGKATAFAFDSPAGETLSWTFVGVRGVDDQVPEPTVRTILGTVRLVDSTP
ncbi:hypothetical protein [Streptomyces rubiginosohelvolus]|uniref:hypothetical protein n=1 Tax=Streptomyces rubiginosohelvolus TaxID=67362 RepID=UPI0036B4BE8B